MNTKTLEIYNLEKLADRVQTLNRKAAKLGLTPVTYKVLSVETKFVQDRLLERREVFDHYVVEVSFDYEQVKLPGAWQLVGVIDHQESLVKAVPGAPLPESGLRWFVERGSVCDHCKTSRQRNETFLLFEPSGNFHFIQVGRDCVGSFLGIDPGRVLAQFDLSGEVAEIEDDEYGHRVPKGYDLSYFLAHTACMIRTAGWRSRSQASEGNRATADLTLDNIVNQETRQKDRYGVPAWVDPSKADGEVAAKVAAWLVEVSGRSGLGDYMGNLAQIGANGFVTPKSAGFAASAINAYLKENEETVKRAAKRASGEGGQYIATLGLRIKRWQVEKVSSAGRDTEWGYVFFHRFIDFEGNTLVWKTQKEVDNGQYLLTGTVKEHKDFNGVAQTYVTNCKLVAEEWKGVAA